MDLYFIKKWVFIRSLISLSWVFNLIGEEASEEEMVGVPQKVLSLQVDMERRRRLMEGLGEEEVQERARLMSLGLPQAGSWLTMAPILALGLHMCPQEFVLAARLRLGMAVYSQAGPCPACHQHSDVTVVNPLQRATVAGAATTAATPPPTPTRGRCGERGRPAGGRASPSCRWW